MSQINLKEICWKIIVRRTSLSFIQNEKEKKNQLATGNKQVQIIDILKNQVLIIQNFTQDSLPHNTNRVLSTTRLLEIQIVAAKFESP